MSITLKVPLSHHPLDLGSIPRACYPLVIVFVQDFGLKPCQNNTVVSIVFIVTFRCVFLQNIIKKKIDRNYFDMLY